MENKKLVTQLDISFLLSATFKCFDLLFDYST